MHAEVGALGSAHLAGQGGRLLQAPNAAAPGKPALHNYLDDLARAARCDLGCQTVPAQRIGRLQGLPAVNCLTAEPAQQAPRAAESLFSGSLTCALWLQLKRCAGRGRQAPRAP